MYIRIAALAVLGFLVVLPALANDSCSGKCNADYDRSLVCQCNTRCPEFGNCCSDYNSVCQADSCSGKCNADYDRSLPCQCNTRCPEFGNCCSDYSSLCRADSCSGKCNTDYDRSLPCQCNTRCPEFGNCCSDYGSVCQAGEITEDELMLLGDQLWDADTNRFASSDLTLDVQARTTASNSEDLASRPLFLYVNEEKLQEQSYTRFIALLDNYNTATGQVEPQLTRAEQQETDQFLDYVLSTRVMRIVDEFLVKKGKVNAGEMKQVLYDLWFEFYGRSSKQNFADSSGFEHSFVGEFKSNSVTGFHNWIQMYLLEKAGKLDYMGYNAKSEPNLMDNHFTWEGLEKQRGSMFVGTSPEFDFALYTLCMLARPGQTCTTSIQGSTFSIQTYDVSHLSGLQVASAFPMVARPFCGEAHTLFNACHQRSPERQWREAAYKVQMMYWQDAVDISHDEQERLTADLVSQLNSIRCDVNSSLPPLNGLISNWDCKTDNLDSSHNISNTRDFCKKAEQMSTSCNDKLKEFVKHIIQKSVKLCKVDQPCKFAAVAMGSLAKGESTPFSDLEFMFIIESKDTSTVKYFELLAMTIYFLIGNLRETKLKYMNIKELKGFEDTAKNGFKIDGLQPEAGNIPTGNGTAEQKNKFILTVDELTKKYQSVLDNPDPVESLKGDFTAMLAHTALLYGEKRLLEEFESAKQKMMTNNARKQAHILMLQQDIKDYVFLPLNTMTEDFYRVNLKSDIYRYPSILVYNLKIIYGIRSESSWETLDKLLELQLVSMSFYHSLRFLLASAQYIRMAAYLHHDSQNEHITFLQENNVTENDPIDGLWHMPRSLVIHMSLHIITVKPMIRTRNQSDVLAALKRAVVFDKELTSAKVHYYMEEYEESARILEKHYSTSQPTENFAEELSMLLHSCRKIRQGHKILPLVKFCEENELSIHFNGLQLELLSWELIKAGIYAEAGLQEQSIQIISKVRRDLSSLPNSVEMRIVKAECYHTIAEEYREMKMYKEAAECLEFSWEAFTAVLVDDGQKMVNEMRECRARFLFRDGVLYTAQGDNSQSLEAIMQSLEQFEGIYGTGSVQFTMAYCYHTLATAHNRSGNYIEAIQLYKQAIDILATINLEDDVIYMYLACALSEISDQEWEETWLQQAYQVLERNPERSPQNVRDLADIICSLPGIRNAPQRFQEAIDYLQNGLSMCSEESYQGAVGVSLLNYELGDAYTEMGQYDEALSCLQKATSVKPCETDKDHVNSLFKSYNTMARILKAKGPYAQVVEDIRKCYRNALSLKKISKRKPIPEGEKAKTYILLAQTYMMDDKERAHSLLVKAFQLTTAAIEQHKSFIIFNGDDCTNALVTLESAAFICINFLAWLKDLISMHGSH